MACGSMPEIGVSLQRQWLSVGPIAQHPRGLGQSLVAMEPRFGARLFYFGIIDVTHRAGRDGFKI